jgi:hypothetical protein
MGVRRWPVSSDRGRIRGRSCDGLLMVPLLPLLAPPGEWVPGEAGSVNCGLSALRDDPDALGVVCAEVPDGLVFRRLVPGLGRRLGGESQHDGDLPG